MAAEPKVWRLPLQLGTGALTRLIMGAVLYVPALVSVIITIYVLAELGIDGEIGGYLCVPAFTFAFFTWRQLDGAWRLRPSDLELDAKGVIVRRGAYDGRAFEWKQLKSTTVAPPDTKGEGEGAYSRLIVWVANASHTVALGESTDERAAIDDISATLAAHIAPREQADETGHEVLRCTSCNGVLIPSTEVGVKCTWCGAPQVMPEAIRTRVANSQTIANRPTRTIERVLSQPRIEVFTFIYFAGALFMMAAWPIAIGVVVWNHDHVASLAACIGFLLLFVVATAFGFGAIVRGVLVDRQTMRLLAVNFSAAPGEKAGDPPRCRSCLAPLPVADENALAVCVFCGAPNVRGLDLSARASNVESEMGSLDALLRRRTSQRVFWRVAAVAGVLLVGVAVWALNHSLQRAPGWERADYVRHLQVHCIEGVPRACIEQAIAMLDGELPVSLETVFVELRRGCERDDADACEGLARANEQLMMQRDPVLRDLSARGKACDLGRRESCLRFADQLESGEPDFNLAANPEEAARRRRQVSGE